MVAVKGFGHGMRAVIEAIDPSCNVIGNPVNRALIAW